LGYSNDDFADIVGSTLGFVLTLIFIWPLTRIVSGLVEEKELKLKASMQLMGLGQASLFFSWLTTYTIIFAIISLILCLCSFWGIYSNSFIIFIFILYFFFGMTVFSWGYLISAFFDNAKTASAFGSIIFLLTFFISFVTDTEGTSEGTKIAVCIIPTVCLSQTAKTISQLEGLGAGLTTTTISQSIQNFTPGSGIGMLVFDFLLYTLIGLYFNQITKSHFGISQPWYFLCKPSFWCGSKYSRKGTPCGCCRTEHPSDRSLSVFDPVNSNEPDTKLEPPLKDDQPVIQIRNLRKTFPGTTGGGCCKPHPDFVAVKDLSLDMYKDQIYILLGENGAGKSTTFNMLTGLISPTSGQALINNYSLENDIQQIYKHQGVCFQHDVLYPNLTVREHMRLFASIKDMDVSKAEVEDHIIDLLDTVGLGPKGDNKLNSPSSTLSGGQKRKLSIAIALLNNPTTLFCDEPSTGVDVASQKTLWKVLLEARKDRVIVMTTHSMEEASAIGDKIGILAAGKLMCSGSNLFLKENYGVGYTLTINKETEIDTQADQLDEADFDDEAAHVNQTTTHDVATIEELNRPADPTTKSGKKIRDYMSKNFPFAILANDSAGEIAFKLPLSAAEHFPQMLDSLDAEKGNLNITTYGVGVTSLTEVFLRAIGGQSREELHEIEDENNNLEKDKLIQVETKKERRLREKNMIDNTWGSVANNITQLSAATIFWRHFTALFIKRWYNFRRDGKAALWTLLYPGIILLAGGLALKYAVKRELPRRTLNPSLYPIDTPFVIANPDTTNPVIRNIHQSLFDIGERYNQIVNFAPQPTETIEELQQFLQDTYDDQPFKTPRFGAVLFENANNIPSTDPTIPPSYKMSLHFNTTSSDSFPTYSNFISNALLSTTNPDATITTINAPLPLTKRVLALIGSSLSLVLAIAMSFVPASYAAYVVRERQDNVKHLQQVSGVSNLSYWAAMFAWDVCNFILPFFVFIIILFSLGIEAINEPSGAVLIVVSLWLFVIASCPFTYALSFLFDSHTTAQNMTLLINFLSSVVLLILSFLLTIIESTRSANKVLRFFYRLLPGFTLGDVFMQLLIREQIYPDSKSAWEPHIAGWDLIFFVFDFILYSGLVILLEHWSSNNTLEWIKGGCTSISADNDELYNDPEEDEDVYNMRKRVQNGEFEKDTKKNPIILKGLRKVYPSKTGRPFMAVSNVFMNVELGKCLGLLGANGCGKSTTMKMLTSDIYPSQGSKDATIGGYSLLHQSEKIRHLLGYCPQFDALLPLLTAREHLELYASIKCVPKDKIPGYVNFLLQKLGLVHLQHRPAGTYSGGNRRKLSLGLALIGNPLILLLDEFSSGCDPSSRRILWKLISSTSANRAVILVSHSVEELEGLSSHIAIMASGRIRAYGTPLHLKTRHGNGLQVELQCADGKQNDVKEWFTTTFHQELTVVEEHRVMLKYAIPKEHYNITEVFRTMEEAKKSNVGIESYSVSETTLEQIFIKFIKADDERRAKNDGFRT
jgi:ABC-type multidrug transport system ATPase subunit